MNNLIIKNENFYEKDGYLFSKKTNKAITSTQTELLGYYGDETTRDIRFCDKGVLVENHTIITVNFDFYNNDGEKVISKSYSHYDEPMSILKENGVSFIRKEYINKSYNYICEFYTYNNTYSITTKRPPVECDKNNDLTL